MQDSRDGRTRTRLRHHLSALAPVTSPTRTSRSTQRAERSILDAVDRIASRP